VKTIAELEKEREAALNRRAMEAIRGTYAAEAPNGLVDMLLTRIVEAMKWAETQ
jgi:hypothetical protein